MSSQSARPAVAERTRSRWRAAALLCTFCALGAPGCGDGGAGASAPVHAPERSALVATRTLEPGPALVTLPEKTGVLEAARRAALSFETSGQLQFLAQDGARVEPGEVVARLDSVMQSASLRQAELELADARRQWERFGALKRGAAAVSDADLERARTELDLRTAQHAIAAEQLARRQLVTPIAGVVTDVSLELGERVRPEEPVLRVVDLAELEIRIGVASFQVTRVRPDARALLRVPALRDAVFEGVVHHVAPAPPAGEHLFPVEIRVANAPAPSAPDSRGPSRSLPAAPDPASRPTLAEPRGTPPGTLRPGMSARVEIVIEERPRALAIPAEAMVELPDGPVVFFVSEGRAVAVPVPSDELHAGEVLLPESVPHREIVLRGQHDLVDGAPVRVDNRVLREPRP